MQTLDVRLSLPQLPVKFALVSVRPYRHRRCSTRSKRTLRNMLVSSHAPDAQGTRNEQPQWPGASSTNSYSARATKQNTDPDIYRHNSPKDKKEKKEKGKRKEKENTS